MALKVLSILLICCLFTACGGGGGGSGDENACGELNIKVTGGTQCRFEQSPVVLIAPYDRSQNLIGVCTGTVISSTAVLTAGHCLDDGAVGALVIARQQIFESRAISIHPQFNGSPGSPFDLGVVSVRASLGLSPVPLLLSKAVAVGDTIAIYGYGQDEEGKTVEELGLAALKAGYMKIDFVSGGLFTASFDDTGVAVCDGDSGGPVVESHNERAGLVGVTSFAVDGCKEESSSGFVSMQIPENYQFVLGLVPDWEVF